MSSRCPWFYNNTNLTNANCTKNFTFDGESCSSLEVRPDTFACYCELLVGGSFAGSVGLTPNIEISSNPPGGSEYSFGYKSDGNIVVNGVESAFGDSFGDGDVIGIAIDAAGTSAWISLNGVWQGGGDPYTLANPISISFFADWLLVHCWSTGTSGTLTIKTDNNELSHPPTSIYDTRWGTEKFDARFCPPGQRVLITSPHSLGNPTLGGVLLKLNASSGSTSFNFDTFLTGLGDNPERLAFVSELEDQKDLACEILFFDSVNKEVIVWVEPPETNWSYFGVFVCYDFNQLLPYQGVDSDVFTSSFPIVMHLDDMYEIDKGSSTSYIEGEAFGGAYADTGTLFRGMRLNGINQVMRYVQLSAYYTTVTISCIAEAQPAGTSYLYHGGTGESGFAIVIVDNKIGIAYWTTQPTKLVTTVGPDSLPSDGSFDLSVVIDGTTITPYVNGLPQSSFTIGQSVSSYGYITLGGNNILDGTSFEDCYTGMIEEFRISYSALASFYILSGYQAKQQSSFVFEITAVLDPIIDSIPASFFLDVVVDNNVVRIDPILSLGLGSVINLTTVGAELPIALQADFALNSEISLDSVSIVIIEHILALEVVVDGLAGGDFDVLSSFTLSANVDVTNLLALVWAKWLPSQDFLLTNDGRTADLTVDSLRSIRTDGSFSQRLDDKIYFEVLVDEFDVSTLSAFLGFVPIENVDDFGAGYDSGSGVHWSSGVLYQYRDGARYPALQGSWAVSGDVLGFAIGYDEQYSAIRSFVYLNGVSIGSIFFNSFPDALRVAFVAEFNGNTRTLISDPNDLIYPVPDGYTGGLLGIADNAPVAFRVNFELGSVLESTKDGYQSAIFSNVEFALSGVINAINQIIVDAKIITYFEFSCQVEEESGLAWARFAPKYDIQSLVYPEILDEGLLYVGSGEASGEEFKVVIDSIPNTGKVYIEFKRESATFQNAYQIAVSPKTIDRSQRVIYGYVENDECAYYSGGLVIVAGVELGYGDDWDEAGDVIGIAIDVDAGNIWFAVNNVWQAGGNPWNLEFPINTIPIPLTERGFEVYCQGTNSNAYDRVVLQSSPDTHSFSPPSGFSATGFMVDTPPTPDHEPLPVIFALSCRVLAKDSTIVEYAAFDPEYNTDRAIYTNNNKTVVGVGLDESNALIGVPLGIADKFYFELIFEMPDIAADPEFTICLAPEPSDPHVGLDAIPLSDYLRERDDRYTTFYRDSDQITLRQEYIGNGDVFGIIVDSVKGVHFCKNGEPYGWWTPNDTTRPLFTKSVYSSVLLVYLAGSQGCKYTLHSAPEELVYTPPEGYGWGFVLEVGSVVYVEGLFDLACNMETKADLSASISCTFILTTDPMIIGTEGKFQVDFNLLLTPQVWAVYSPLYSVDFNMILGASVEIEDHRIGIESAFSLFAGLTGSSTSYCKVSASFELGSILSSNSPSPIINVSATSNVETVITSEPVGDVSFGVLLGLNCYSEATNDNQSIDILSRFALKNAVVAEDVHVECQLPVYSINRWT